MSWVSRSLPLLGKGVRGGLSFRKKKKKAMRLLFFSLFFFPLGGFEKCGFILAEIAAQPFQLYFKTTSAVNKD